ncbi:MAG: TaqI-like C-terminal specificity domain-containing protein [Candidatus Lokiarchaeota archaeon]
MELKNSQLSQIFTPDYVAEFMVKNAKKYYLTSHNIENLDLVKVLEPCVGKGIFLKYLLKEGFTNITAYELDKSIKPYLLKEFPYVKFKFKNFLGSTCNIKYDIIIGNPPYLGQNYNAVLFQDLVKNYDFCKKYFVGNMDLFYFFIHKGITKLNPGALLSYITTNYWITKSSKTGIKNIKPHIKKECNLLQYVDLSPLKIFRDATGQHNCIFTLQKKINDEKRNNVNRDIDIVQIRKPSYKNTQMDYPPEFTFSKLLLEEKASNILRYKSAITNKELKEQGNWNLLYPIEVKNLMSKIEEKCKNNGKVTYLKDYFLIRNGLKKLLKRIYKSKSISKFGFQKEDFIGYGLYFNKREFIDKNDKVQNFQLKKKYPVLSAYLEQFEPILRKILTNAKENPEDIYFPRRGAFIWKSNQSAKYLCDLEPWYEQGQKIFFSYISKENVFGYTESPYYATSDTYFLWPGENSIEINYFFIIAYLNSELVKFLFSAKNIKIKRSKTKLENNLAIPNMNIETSPRKNILELIIILTEYLISIITNNNEKQTRVLQKEEIDSNLKSIIQVSDYLSDYLSDYYDSENIAQAIINKNNLYIQNLIDGLFYTFFDVSKEEIKRVMEKYYKK